MRSDPAKAMKIAELARVSGTTRSTIHFYRNLGLLPPPLRRGPKLHLYGVRHVQRLQELATLRAAGVSIAALQRRFARQPRAAREPPAPDRSPPPRRSVPKREADLAARERLLDLAARAFVERGYDGVRVADLAREAEISKATFYGWFASKADLFVDCLDRLRHVVISPRKRAAVTPALSFEEESRLRAEAVVEHADAYLMMTNLLAQAATSSDAALARRARDARHRMITGARPMFERAIARGECRALDPELLAYVTWGALLALADRLAFDDRFTRTEALEALHDFVRRGLGA